MGGDPREYSDGWQVDGVAGIPTLAGTIAFDAPGDALTVSYAPWRWLLPATFASTAVLFALIVGGLIGIGEHGCGDVRHQHQAGEGTGCPKTMLASFCSAGRRLISDRAAIPRPARR